ncbi:MAG: hypothetical protein KW806_01110 [Candidatus Yanofskybacteria bacterium]|nr:hypothetical protein [Candidatus Yanofskybacteria bacterium]
MYEPTPAMLPNPADFIPKVNSDLYRMPLNTLQSVVALPQWLKDFPGNISWAAVEQYVPGVQHEVNIFLSIIKFVGLVISLLAGAVIISLVVRMYRMRHPKPTVVQQDIEQPAPAYGGAMAARWEEIVKHLDSAREAQWRIAIIEADKLIDEVLRRAGYPGGSLGEKLMNIKAGDLQTLDGLWEAHKVRNKIAHDINYFLRYSEAKRVIELYAQALKELQAL